MRISDWSSDVCSSDLDLVPEEGDAPGGVLIVRGEKLDRVAAHAERPALEGGLVAFVLEGDQLPDDLARVVRLPLGEAERHCRIGFDRPYAVKTRSEERRVGKEGVSTCRSRWSPYHKKKKH